MFRKSIEFFCALSAATLLCSCTTFQDRELTRATQWPPAASAAAKPVVVVALSCSSGDPQVVVMDNRCSRVGGYQYPADIMPLLDKVLAESKLFASYRFAPVSQYDADYTLEIKLTNHFHEEGFHPLDSINATFNRLSLGLIPEFDSDRYVLAVKLLDRRNQNLALVANTDSTTTWSGVWFLPITSYPPSAGDYRAFEGTVANQLHIALNDLANRGVLVKAVK